MMPLCFNLKKKSRLGKFCRINNQIVFINREIDIYTDGELQTTRDLRAM